ncbi:transglycosylase SLT domain-containing protein [Salmonella enterica subsp. enterica serovar Heidelberg]|uniref:Lytic transglycosylase domain-containing protein n=2 Tax=Escherichia coli TaxID=562 RepID=A0A797HZZ8_ECOLX|nr:transglycosylase SLT domain-containing protein [Escherichia coli]EEC6439884.1 lytic transglycosylase domain-containing protein [Salmonella enterica subsp. enterica serovar 4,[5],12:i:-]EFV0995306.1 lytic transglycosylase domain-containing protein [Salmonella enterica]EEZ4327508.1 lytic transglycosylase domain-containing protein [Escherichia coli]EFC2703466.1 lytic transglycosylase domain-containing protein [Escherichia coli]EFV5113509.1 lytic transglycosylase domain-containing protein [Salm
MERKNANIDDVIRTVETASAKELEELAGIREAVEDLKGERVATVDPVSRSVSALNRTIENSRPDFVTNAPSVDPIVDAIKRLNLGDVSRIREDKVTNRAQQAAPTAHNPPNRRREAITEDVKAQRLETVKLARDLKGERVATVDPVSRSVSALNRTIENSRPDFVANAPSVDPIVDAMKRLNLGDVSRVVQEGIAQQEQQAKSTTPKGKKRRRKAIPEDIKAQRTEAAEHAREMFDQKGGAQKSQNQRDARGRFIGKSGSKAAAEDARAERAEKARRKEDDERLNAESGLLKKLSKVAEGIGNPSETRAVDALGYAVAGPLWAAGKELGGISKEVGGSLNGARKSIADVIRGNDDNSRRKGFFRRKSQNSADVVQVNTQKRTVQELQEQTSEIKEGNDKILSALDQIAKNTGKKKGGLLSKLFSLLGKGAGGVASLLMGRGMLKKAGALAFGALGAKKLVGMLRGGGKKTIAHEGGDLAARAAGKLGLKAVGKGALRAIPLVGTVAGGIYDAVTGWNDTEAQRRAFGLKSGQDPSFQQKAAYTLANVLDMGGLVSGISSAIGEVLKSLGFEDIGNMLQSFSTESIAQAIDSGITNLETYISNLGDTISTKFEDYTAKIGDAVSAWFSDTSNKLLEKLGAIKDFFTVDNLKQVFSDAIDSAIDFIKNPGKHIKEAAGNIWDGVKNLPGKALDAAVDAVKNTPAAMIVSKIPNPIGEANAKEITPELKAPVNSHQETSDSKTESDAKQTNIATRVINAALDTAKDSNKTVKETANQIINANAVETGNSAVRKIDSAIGQNSSSSSSRNTTGTGNDIQKAADTYNNGSLDVKVGSLGAEGKANLDKLAPYFAELENKYGLPEGTLYAIAATESGGDPNAKSPLTRSPDGKLSGGALGMFQFTSIARKETGISEPDAFDPVKSAEAAALLMSKYLKQANGDLNEAITAYNAGFGTINKWKKGTGDLSKENREYAIKVNTHRARYLGGEIYTPGAGAQGGAQYGVRGPLPDNAVIDQSTGLAFTPGDSPFEKGGLVDKIGNAVGVNDLVNKFMNGRGMRREVVQGTLEERARGKGTATAAGNVYVDTPMPVEEARPVASNSSYFDQLGAQMGIDGLYDKLINARGMRSNNSPQPASTSQVTTAVNDLQQPTGRMQIDGQVISDLGGSGAKPTMQLADNTVSLDGETKRLFAQMTSLLARIEEHTKDSAKGQGTVVKVSTPQPGVMRTVPLSIDDPLMNDYARVD